MSDEKETTISIRAVEAERDAYEKAAKAACMSRHAWMKMILNAASGVSDLPNQMMRVIEVQQLPVRDGQWE